MCTSYFEWRTNLACTTPVSDKEVKCSVFDKGEKRDLSALVKNKGAYLVDTSDSWRFYINVCRDINPGSIVWYDRLFRSGHPCVIVKLLHLVYVAVARYRMICLVLKHLHVYMHCCWKSKLQCYIEEFNEYPNKAKYNIGIFSVTPRLGLVGREATTVTLSDAAKALFL